MLNSKALGGLVACLVLTSAGVADAQWGYRGGWGNMGAGSTAAGSYALGMSELVQAQGQANLLNAAAAGQLEDARSKYLDNRIKATQTYFDMRKMNRDYRAQEARPATNSEQIYRLAHQGAPRRPTDLQLDPVSGAIGWPALLLDERYAAAREVLDTLFKARVEGTAPSDAFGRIKMATDEMLAILAKSVRDYSVADYSAAQKFIRSIWYESSFPQA